jgi:hypothetical protein
LQPRPRGRTSGKDRIEAARKCDWKGYAELVHPESLADYKCLWLPALTAAAKGGRDKRADLLPLFDKATDIKSVMALKPKEFFVRSMRGMASQFRQGIASPLNVDGKIIGTVYEGDDQAYVVVRTRTKIGQTEMAKVEVIALKRDGTKWKLVLPDVVRIMAETFRRTLQVGPQKSGPMTDPASPDKEDAARQEMKKLQGTWRLVSEVIAGEKCKRPAAPIQAGLC